MLYICAISDSIGETANQISAVIASQFRKCISIKKYSYIDTLKKADEVIDGIKKYDKVMIISTIINIEIGEYLYRKSLVNNIIFINALKPMIDAASKLLGFKPNYIAGAVRQIDEEYFKRIEAMEFAIQYDDSKDYRGLEKADVVLIGLSRTAKTPLSIYLANKGIKAINIPILPEVGVPEELYKIDRRKIVCLTIDPLELIEIRKKRIEKFNRVLSSMEYAGEERVLKEFDFLDTIIKRLRCKVIDVTKRAIEDTALIIEESIGIMM